MILAGMLNARQHFITAKAEWRRDAQSAEHQSKKVIARIGNFEICKAMGYRAPLVPPVGLVFTC